MRMFCQTANCDFEYEDNPAMAALFCCPKCSGTHFGNVKPLPFGIAFGPAVPGIFQRFVTSAYSYGAAPGLPSARFAHRLTLLILAALLFFASAANAQEPSLQKPVDPPKPTLRHRVFDKKFLAVTVVNVGMSIAATRALVRCRHDHGIGPCNDGGYGEFQQREAIRQVLTGTLVFCSYYAKQAEDRDQDKYKFWWTLQAFNTGWNAGGFIRNYVHTYPPKYEE